jgi:F-box domain
MEMQDTIAAATQYQGMLALSKECLEEILEYLPEEYVVDLSLTCKQVKNTLDGGSARLWRCMLKRNKWPYSEEITKVSNNNHQDKSNQELRDHIRKTFIGHYTGISAAESTAAAIYAVETNTLTFGIAYKPIPSSADSDFDSHEFDSMEVWSKDSLVVSNYDDCTISLYELVLNEEGTHEVQETANLCVAPSCKHNGLTYNIFSTSISSEYTCCLLGPSGILGSDISRLMVFVDRDEFLQCKPVKIRGGIGTRRDAYHQPSMAIVNTRHAILKFLRTCRDDQAVHLDHVKKLLRRGGDVSNVEFDSMGEVGPCGNDQFVVEVRISWPNGSQTNDNEQENSNGNVDSDKNMIANNHRRNDNMRREEADSDSIDGDVASDDGTDDEEGAEEDDDGIVDYDSDNNGPLNRLLGGRNRNGKVTRNLVMFSASTGAVVWIGDCTSLFGRHVNEIAIINVDASWCRSSSLFAACEGDGARIMIGEVQESTAGGGVNVNLFMLQIARVRGCKIRAETIRPVQVLPDCVVTTEPWVSLDDEELEKTTISFFRRPSAGQPFTCKTCTLKDCYKVECLVALNDTHVGVLNLRPARDTAELRRNPHSRYRGFPEFIVFDVTTCKELYRVQFQEYGDNKHRDMQFVAYHDGMAYVCTEDGGVSFYSRDVVKSMRKTWS